MDSSHSSSSSMLLQNFIQQIINSHINRTRLALPFPLRTLPRFHQTLRHFFTLIPAPSCVRCGSPNTHFRYFDNYSTCKTLQPRYVCLHCNRKFTQGGKPRSNEGRCSSKQHQLQGDAQLQQIDSSVDASRPSKRRCISPILVHSPQLHMLDRDGYSHVTNRGNSWGTQSATTNFPDDETMRNFQDAFAERSIEVGRIFPPEGNLFSDRIESEGPHAPPPSKDAHDHHVDATRWNQCQAMDDLSGTVPASELHQIQISSDKGMQLDPAINNTLVDKCEADAHVLKSPYSMTDMMTSSSYGADAVPAILEHNVATICPLDEGHQSWSEFLSWTEILLCDPAGIGNDAWFQEPIFDGCNPNF